jgi:hypothetical protein
MFELDNQWVLGNPVKDDYIKSLLIPIGTGSLPIAQSNPSNTQHRVASVGSWEELIYPQNNMLPWRAKGIYQDFMPDHFPKVSEDDDAPVWKFAPAGGDVTGQVCGRHPQSITDGKLIAFDISGSIISNHLIIENKTQGVISNELADAVEAILSDRVMVATTPVTLLNTVPLYISTVNGSGFYNEGTPSKIEERTTTLTTTYSTGGNIVQITKEELFSQTNSTGNSGGYIGLFLDTTNLVSAAIDWVWSGEVLGNPDDAIHITITTTKTGDCSGSVISQTTNITGSLVHTYNSSMINHYGNITLLNYDYNYDGKFIIFFKKYARTESTTSSTTSEPFESPIESSSSATYIHSYTFHILHNIGGLLTQIDLPISYQIVGSATDGGAASYSTSGQRIAGISVQMNPKFTAFTYTVEDIESTPVVLNPNKWTWIFNKRKLGIIVNGALQEYEITPEMVQGLYPVYNPATYSAVGAHFGKMLPK